MKELIIFILSVIISILGFTIPMDLLIMIGGSGIGYTMAKILIKTL